MYITLSKKSKKISEEEFFAFLLKIRDIVNIAELERLADLPKRTISKHYNYIDIGKGWPISMKHADAIISTISNHILKPFIYLTNESK